MGYVRFKAGTRAECRVGVVLEESVFDLSEHFETLAAAIDADDQATSFVEDSPERVRSYGLDEVRLLAPVDHPDRPIYAVGWNYLDHFDEGKRAGGHDEDLPEHPTFFAKAPGTVIGPYDSVACATRYSDRWDYEGELAAHIGSDIIDCDVGEAIGAVAGFSIANDVSARDVQRRHGGQWFKGKSLDRTCPIGPWIVPAGRFDPSRANGIRTMLDGQVVQESSTANMAFSVARIVSELSRGMTLRRGDIVLTGTPSGVGYARTPPLFLKPGMTLVTEIEGIGHISNTIVET